jgi:hypothetical protein
MKQAKTSNTLRLCISAVSCFHPRHICAEIKDAYDARQKDLVDVYRAIGCSGISNFERLPYFRCAVSVTTSTLQCTEGRTGSRTDACSRIQPDETIVCRWHLFWAFHIAHALIYGVVAVLWKFLLRPPKNADSGGPEAAHIILSTTVRQAMSRRVHADNLKSTGCLSGKIPDVTKCVLDWARMTLGTYDSVETAT